MKSRIPNLDLFRFIAIAGVIYFHISERFLASYIPRSVVELGRYGVEMFFTLSGFLIGSIYYKNAEKVNLVKFWLQRFLRTYPPYLVALLVYAGIAYFSKHQHFNFGYLVFLQNFYHKLPIFKISWSLCVEEHFYLVFPFLMLVLDRWIKNKKVSLIAWIIICLLPSLIRYQFGDYRVTFGYAYTATIFKFDGIALGCFLAFIINTYDVSKLRSTQLYNVILFTSFMLLGYWLENPKSELKYTIGYLALMVNVAVLLFSFYTSGNIYTSTSAFVKRGALMAYSLYLTHAMVLNAVDAVRFKYNINPALTSPVCVIGIIISGYIYYMLVEQKSIVLRNKILGH